MEMMQMTVAYSDDRTETVTVLPVTRVAFERHFKVPIASLEAEPFEERVLWLAWHASARGRPNLPGYDAWLETIIGVELHVDEDDEVTEPDPLARSGSPGSSLPSPSSPALASPSTRS